ncbi:putative aryl-alcohol dehydrogenase AAD14 [Lachnellula suecica]|uniref:Putative aryl-alcohol dehydrogenase AAD14 n=1 Tax=Lachnellula suecica TaxID=602035 RepID=A0A8T9BYD3_9HELO|nr:putative aryl-alcohol dehydrogenase AAD14 [Lachnellula suecica]
MADFMTPAPDPPTLLGRHQVLSSSAGVKVSPLCLGGMSIGDAWNSFMGSTSKEQSFTLLDAFYAAGGNFIDTANNCQDEQSESWIGEWMASRGNRDNVVVATKFTWQYKAYQGGAGPRWNNATGNHKRSLHVSVRDSLAKLQTDWIDIFDTPAWVVSAANYYAKTHGKTPFSIYQGNWSVMLRDMERDIIPMACHFGMAIAPYGALGSGKLQSAKQIEGRNKSGEGLRAVLTGPKQTSDELRMSQALEKVGKEVGVDSVTAVALAYVRAKAPNVFPIIGGRKVEHLMDNVKCLEIRLSEHQIAYLESVKDFDVGFPGNFFGTEPKMTGKPSRLLASTGSFSFAKSFCY